MSDIEETSKKKASSSSTEVSILSLPLGENNSKHKFQSQEDLWNFINDESKFWHWLTQQPENTDSKLIGSHLHTSLVAPILEILNKIASQWDGSQSACDTTIEELTHILEHINFPFSNRLVGQHIENNKEKSPLTCIYLLYLSSNPSEGNSNAELNTILNGLNAISITQNPLHINKLQKAFVNTELYRLKANRILTQIELIGTNGGTESLASNLKQSKVRVEKIRGDCDSFYKELKTWKEKEEKKYNEWLHLEEKKRKTIGFRILRKIIKTKKDYLKECSEIFERGKQKVENAEQVYLSQVELAAATTYWETKKIQHNKSKKKWLGTIVGLLAAIGAMPFIITATLNKEGFPKEELILHAFQPASIFSSVLFISLLSFFIRISSKQFSTHSHLYLEAVERKTMLKTYLALMKEEKLSEQEDRKIALDSLFRPAQTGIVADSGSISPVDSIIKIIEKQVKPGK